MVWHLILRLSILVLSRLILTLVSRMRFRRSFSRNLNVFLLFCPRTSRRSSIMGTVSSICGRFSITCYQCAQIMVIASIGHSGRHMFLLIRYLLIK
ncbi:hypothetical protein BVRB_6g149170 [Beta vulgaris subsp. vulgaris]|nr:hypothetical protein BVRB_6g149170 [Beta vulgaris subsp. vulgaris]